MPIIAPLILGVGAGAIAERYGIPIPAASMIAGRFKPSNAMQIEQQALNRANTILRAEEGYRLDVYKDSLGFLTVGIGHKVLPQDNLKFGDRISAARADAFFKSDIGKAFAAAKKQAQEINKYNPEMIARLTSVNFQIGTGWRYEFPNTWAYIKQGNIGAATKNLRASLWARQTPNRVAAFISTLQTQFA